MLVRRKRTKNVIALNVSKVSGIMNSAERDSRLWFLSLDETLN